MALALLEGRYPEGSTVVVDAKDGAIVLVLTSRRRAVVVATGPGRAGRRGAGGGSAAADGHRAGRLTSGAERGRGAADVGRGQGARRPGPVAVPVTSPTARWPTDPSDRATWQS